MIVRKCIILCVIRVTRHPDLNGTAPVMHPNRLFILFWLLKTERKNILSFYFLMKINIELL